MNIQKAEVAIKPLEREEGIHVDHFGVFLEVVGEMQPLESIQEAKQLVCDAVNDWREVR
jgi:hypothetical protein